MKTKQPFYQIVLSVLAAVFGIQSSKKASEDFKETSPWVFILIGVVFLVLFVSTLAFVVSRVTASLP